MSCAAIYARVSTARQAERDLSLPDQIAQCRAYCERQGWEIVEVFCEPGASALDDDRAVFQEMIYKATGPDRPFTFIVVYSLSRFSRDSLHSELYVRKLRKAGVELVSITQTVSSDPSGEMFRKLLNVFDEHQSRENAKHVHRAMCENARQGFWNGSHPPFGYKTQIAERRGAKDKKVLVIDDEEACVVREIFALAAGREGRPFGVKAIACRLTERGSPGGESVSQPAASTRSSPPRHITVNTTSTGETVGPGRRARPRSGLAYSFPQSSTNRCSTRSRRSCRAAARNGRRRAW
jgi:site-specific DNA recombinase